MKQGEYGFAFLPALYLPQLCPFVEGGYILSQRLYPPPRLSSIFSAFPGAVPPPGFGRQGRNRLELTSRKVPGGGRLIGRFRSPKNFGVYHRPEAQHLPLQGQLLGLVHDTHAAAAHLPDDPEVAELGRRAGRGLDGLVDELDAGQALSELRSQGGVCGQELRPVGGAARLEAGEVRIEHAHQSG